MATIFLYEIVGTAVLIMMGVGVVANHLLPKTGGHGGGPLMIHFGWGLAVFAAVWVSFKSGAHLNPAVTVGLFAAGAPEFAPGIATNIPHMLAYFVAQLIGAILGAALAWMAYKKHYDAATERGDILGTFATGPAISAPAWNVITEVLATFVLVITVLSFGETPAKLGPLSVALIVVGIGATLGGPTGYAINPARDLGPRIAHQILPIPGKGHSNWAYAWVPIVGPIIGGILAGLLSRVLIPAS